MFFRPIMTAIVVMIGRLPVMEDRRGMTLRCQAVKFAGRIFRRGHDRFLKL